MADEVVEYLVAKFSSAEIEAARDTVFAARAERTASVGTFLATLTDEHLDEQVDILENGPHPIRECVFTVFEEEFWHLRYTRRDLSML